MPSDRSMTLAEAMTFLTPFADKCWDGRSDMIYGSENAKAGRALKVVLAALTQKDNKMNDAIQQSERPESRVFHHYGSKKFVPFPGGVTRAEWEVIGRRSVERSEDIPND